MSHGVQLAVGLLALFLVAAGCSSTSVTTTDGASTDLSPTSETAAPTTSSQAQDPVTTVPPPTPTTTNVPQDVVIRVKGSNSLGCGLQRVNYVESGTTLAIVCGLYSGMTKDSIFLYDLETGRQIQSHSSANFSGASVTSTTDGFFAEMQVTTPAAGLTEESRSSEVWFIQAETGKSVTLPGGITTVCKGPKDLWIGESEDSWTILRSNGDEVFRIADTRSGSCDGPYGRGILGDDLIAVPQAPAKPSRVFDTSGNLLWTSDVSSIALHLGSPYALEGYSIREASTGEPIGEIARAEPGLQPTRFGSASGLSTLGPVRLTDPSGTELCEIAESVRGSQGWEIDEAGDVWIHAADGASDWILVDPTTCDIAARSPNSPVSPAATASRWSVESSDLDEWVVIQR